MDVSVVIVEQIEENGSMRTFKMRSEPGNDLIIAFAGEYDEERSGPFHFLDGRHEKTFSAAFAECKMRKVSRVRLQSDNGRFRFQTSWLGIPTERRRLSYYALSLPEFAIPNTVTFTDPRSPREYRKSVVRDDQRNRFVLYLECRSSHGLFDFLLNVDFEINPNAFARASFRDETTSEYGFHDAYECLLDPTQQVVVQQFFGEGNRGDIHMSNDRYEVGQAGAVGPGSHAENVVFSQIWNKSEKQIDVKELASELAFLREGLAKLASEPDHFVALGEVAAAEKSAGNGDGAGALQHLKKVGGWVWSTAATIGIGVATAAAKCALGL
jgi:hypothetical protein